VFLTPALLAKLIEVIRKHHLAFIVSVYGPDAVAKEEVEKLKLLGLVDPNAIVSMDEVYLYGRLLAKLNDPAVATWTYEQLHDHLVKNPIPLGPVEENALKAARMSAAHYVKGLGNTVDKQTGQILINADKNLAATLSQGIRNEVEDGIIERKTVKAIKTDLGYALQDWTRNLDRIAITEKHAALSQGVVDEIGAKFGSNARIAFRTMPDACPECLSMFVGPDGHPRIFLLSQVAPHGANHGKPKKAWVPCMPPVHPHCQCMPIHVPPGWGFNEKGQMVPGGQGGVEFTKSWRAFPEMRKAELEHHDNIRKGFRLSGRAEVCGMLIAIEQEPGDIRTWADRNGDSGFVVMRCPYGFFENVIGADGEHLDVYLGPDPEPETVYIVNQRKKLPEGKGFAGFDEQKVMLGFSNADHARRAYLEHYDDERFLGSMEEISLHDFKRFVDGEGNGDFIVRGKPCIAKSARVFVKSDVSDEKPGNVQQASGSGRVLHPDGPGQTIHPPSEEMRIFLRETPKPVDVTSFQRDNIKEIWEDRQVLPHIYGNVISGIDTRKQAAVQEGIEEQQHVLALRVAHIGQAPRADVPLWRFEPVQLESHVLPPDDVVKADGGHKYIAKVMGTGGHWIYKYAAEHGGAVKPHITDPQGVTVKMPKSDASFAKLNDLRKEHGLQAPVLQGSMNHVLPISGAELAKMKPPVVAPPVVPEQPKPAPAPAETTSFITKQQLLDAAVKADLVPGSAAGAKKPQTWFHQAGASVKSVSGELHVEGTVKGWDYMGRVVVEEASGKRRFVDPKKTKIVSQAKAEPKSALESVKHPKGIREPTPLQKQLVHEVLSGKPGPNTPFTAKAFADEMFAKGYECFLVGGIVRDLVTGTDPKNPKSPGEVKKSMHDVDFVLSAPPGVLHTAMQKMGAAPNFIPSFMQRGCVSNGELDLASLSSGGVYDAEVKQADTGDVARPSTFDHDMETDAQRRDFTANALYYDVHNDKVLDPTGQGIDDARSKVLRMLPGKEWAKNPKLAMRFWKFRMRGWTGEAKTTKQILKLVDKELGGMPSSKRAQYIAQQIGKEDSGMAAVAKLKAVMEADGAGAAFAKHIAPIAKDIASLIAAKKG
jgi:hypothetical protein